MQIYFHELHLEEGFAILSEPVKHDRLVRGRRVDRPSGWNFFISLRGTPIRCWCCGVEADRWIAEKGERDLVGHAVLNLYASKGGGIVLMTRDHIIPKSLGGVDANANLRPGCAVCNEARGNDVTEEDVAFAKAHPELIDEYRIRRGLEGMANQLETLKHQWRTPVTEDDYEAVKRPFRMMGYI